MSIRIAFQMDALDHLNKAFDSSLELARAAAEQGHTLYHYEPRHLRMNIGGSAVRVTATGNRLHYKAGAADPWSLGETETLDLSGFDVILMRQDPPFDLGYITATHILERLTDKVRVVNDPIGVRNAPEKLLTTHFPHLMPPTLIARDCAAIKEFRAEHKDIIIKPLHGHAGHGIFHLRPDDDNLPGLVETLTALNNEPWMIQKFLPITVHGDKRIITLDGEPVGVYRRMPQQGDVRANGRVGGRPEKTELTKRDREICAAIAPALKEHGLFFAGVDVIGDCLTEINVTSPTGLIIADKLEGRTGRDRIAEQFWRKLL